MMTNMIQATEHITLSIVIVNYNVKEFLEQCLRSVQQASDGLATEIFVVDNNSVDGSEAMLTAQFGNTPNVHLIFNRENVGFSKANNQALRQCKGDYILVLNPDTLLQEDTLQKMLAFMERDKTIGAAGCKLLNADGTFQLSCRRGFPTPDVSFYKLIGLSALFPNSPRFGRYNLTYLPIDATYEIDALMGAFMLLRREVLETVGLFDESFFMYGEDIDWCYRIKQGGWKIFYVHDAQAIHYKGESTKTESFNYVVRFYEAMLIFVRKYYRGKYAGAFEFFLVVGIYVRASFSALKRATKSAVAPLINAISKTTMSTSHRPRRVGIVGEGSATRLATRLRADINKRYDVVGCITDDDNNLLKDQTCLGELKHLVEIIRTHQLDEVIFISSDVSYADIIGAIASCNGLAVECKIASPNVEVIIGKGTIDKL